MSEGHTITPPRAEGVPAPWIREGIERIQQLRFLPRGWDSYDGEPPNGAAIAWAERIVEILGRQDFLPQWIAPSAEGGVMIGFSRGSRFGSIECYNSGSIVGLTSDGQGAIDVWQIAPDDHSIAAAITRVRRHTDTICQTGDAQRPGGGHALRDPLL
jgi:hypothetical protein